MNSPKKWLVIIVIGVCVVAGLRFALIKRGERQAQAAASVTTTGTTNAPSGNTNAPAKATPALDPEAVALTARLTNELGQLIAKNRELMELLENRAENDHMFRSMIQTNTAILHRHNGARMSEGVERYVLGANPSFEGQPGPNQETRLRLANYIWDSPDKVGGFWVNPGNLAKVRIHGGVAFKVDPDRGLKVWVVIQGGAKTPFENWKTSDPRPPVEVFEISNPSNETLYCNFMPD